MNIHEYQGKSILQSYGVAIQRGKVADTPSAAHEAAVALAEETGTEWFVLKAQIHAGGRGKGVVTETGSHGVVLAKGLEHVKKRLLEFLADIWSQHKLPRKGNRSTKSSSQKMSIILVTASPQSIT